MIELGSLVPTRPRGRGGIEIRCQDDIQIQSGKRLK